MAIKRWNANTSTWELVGTPGTATPSAIGAATLASTGNTFLGVQTITSASEWPLISRFTNPTSTHRNHLLLQRSNNNTAVTSGFNLGGISMSGHDGTNYGLGWNGGAEITAFAAETWTPSARGTHLAFFNTANGTNSIAERMRIDSSGNVGIGTVPANFGGTNLQITHSTNFSSLLVNSGTRTVQILASDVNGVTAIGSRTNHHLGITTNDTERMRILSTGSVLVNTTSLLNNELFGIRNTGNVQTLWLEQTDSNFSTVAQAIRTTRTNNSAYTYFITYSNNGGDTEHYLRGDGQAYADGSWNGGGADYAEYFEWADGNPNNENRLGYAVSLVNDKIKIAEEGETPIGVVSGNPSVVGDHASNKWSGKYLKNDFGVYLRDENGDRILNPEFDPEAEYVSREDRPEWSMVGLMGKLRLRKGQVTGAGWIKMKDISSEVEEWLVK